MYTRFSSAVPNMLITLDKYSHYKQYYLYTLLHSIATCKTQKILANCRSSTTNNLNCPYNKEARHQRRFFVDHHAQLRMMDEILSNR